MKTTNQFQRTRIAVAFGPMAKSMEAIDHIMRDLVEVSILLGRRHHMTCPVVDDAIHLRIQPQDVLESFHCHLMPSGSCMDLRQRMRPVSGSQTANHRLECLPAFLGFLRGRPVLLSGPLGHLHLTCAWPSPTKMFTFPRWLGGNKVKRQNAWYRSTALSDNSLSISISMCKPICSSSFKAK